MFFMVIVDEIEQEYYMNSERLRTIWYEIRRVRVLGDSKTLTKLVLMENGVETATRKPNIVGKAGILLIETLRNLWRQSN